MREGEARIAHLTAGVEIGQVDISPKQSSALAPTKRGAWPLSAPPRAAAARESVVAAGGMTQVAR
jgi:hypothetical protein